jgi:cystathionine gamma-synthase
MGDAVSENTKLLISESPTNPHLSVIDLERFVVIGRRRGVESLIEQPCVMSYHACTNEQRRAFGIPDNMILLSCEIENHENLIADLKQALDRK